MNTNKENTEAVSDARKEDGWPASKCRENSEHFHVSLPECGTNLQNNDS
jgi:hypothetical protein